MEKNPQPKRRTWTECGFTEKKRASNSKSQYQARNPGKEQKTVGGNPLDR